MYGITKIELNWTYLITMQTCWQGLVLPTAAYPHLAVSSATLAEPSDLSPETGLLDFSALQIHSSVNYMINV